VNADAAGEEDTLGEWKHGAIASMMA
jgi:hypothetical protein